MKRIFTILLPLALCHMISAQTGTIKVQKKPKPDPVSKRDTPTRIGFGTFGGNYTFKDIHSFGSTIRFSVPLKWQYLHIGAEYTRECENFSLSAFEKNTGLVKEPAERSVSRSDFIKMPVDLLFNLSYGRNGGILFFFEVIPEYMIATKNQHRRLDLADFNRINVAMGAGIGIPIGKHYSVNVRYSKDLMNNLKNSDLYDHNGTITGKQGSKTDLLSLSVSYYIHY